MMRRLRQRQRQQRSIWAMVNNPTTGEFTNFKVGDEVVPVAKGSYFGAMKLTVVYESHMEAGHLRLNYGHWKHAPLQEVKPMNEACIHGYDIACLLCGFGQSETTGERIWHTQR